MDLIVADTDKAYTTALARRIQQLRPDLVVACCHDSPRLQRLIASRKHNPEPLLFLYNQKEFSELARLSRSQIWPKAWQACPLDGSEPGHSFSYRRLDPVSLLVKQLPPATTCGQPLILQDQADDFSSARLWCTVFFDAAGPAAFPQRLKQLVASGKQVVYLPLMPTYWIDAIDQAGQGPSLADLLVALTEGLVQADEMGVFWQSHAEGFLFFRPPGRADDLLTCGPDVLRALVELFRRKIEQDASGQLLGLIECFGLPAASVQAVAVLCDVCDIRWSDTHKLASDSARFEASALMAALPARCRILQNDQPFSLPSLQERSPRSAQATA